MYEGEICYYILNGTGLLEIKLHKLCVNQKNKTSRNYYINLFKSPVQQRILEANKVSTSSCLQGECV